MDAKDGGSIIQTGVAFNELTSLQNQYRCQNVIFTVPIINTRLNGFDIHVSKYVQIMLCTTRSVSYTHLTLPTIYSV